MAKAAERRADSVHLLQLSSAPGCCTTEVGEVKRTNFYSLPLLPLLQPVSHAFLEPVRFFI